MRRNNMMYKKKYIYKRILQLIVVLLGVTFLTYLITQSTPSDAAEMLYLKQGITPSEELLDRTREEMGLNKPFLTQYGNWLIKVVQGDLGISYHYNEPVFLQLSKKLPGTLKLTGASLFVIVLIAFPLGIICAVYNNKVIDYIIRVISFFGISIPNFWLGLLLTYIFAVKLGWLNVLSSEDISGMILPVATLSIPLISNYVRQIRSVVLEALSQEYVIGAKARGVADWRIILCHVLPNSLPPIITLMGMSIGHLLGGAAIVETIFSWQGIGSMVVEAIRVRDYPVIQGYVIWMAFIYVIVNLIVDISCHILDPN